MTIRGFVVAAVAAYLGAHSMCAPAAAAGPAKLWEVTGLEAPESALPDPEAGVVYVSSVGGASGDKDGNGFISKVSLDGKMVSLKWAAGLDAPKGLARAGERLYVADIDRLVEIDVKTGKALASYPAKGARFLNDVAADGEGRIYVADTFTNTIWRLAEGRFEPWLASKALNSPNGLLVQGDKLIVAPWGVTAEDGKPGVPAGLLEVSLKDKSVRPLGDGTPVGNLDGIEAEGPSTYLVTDWVAGALLRIETSGKVTPLLDFNQGSADIGYVPSTKTVLVPLMNDNRLEAYRIE